MVGIICHPHVLLDPFYHVGSAVAMSTHADVPFFQILVHPGDNDGAILVIFIIK